MGAQQSTHHSKISHGTSFDAGQSFEAADQRMEDIPKQEQDEGEGELMLLKKLLEYEIEARHTRNKFQVLDQNNGIMKVENKMLLNHVSVLSGKLDGIENKLHQLETASKVDNHVFNRRLNRFEYLIKPLMNPQNQAENASCSKSNLLSRVKSTKLKICQEPVKVRTIPTYTKPFPSDLTSLCQVDYCGVCKLKLQGQVMANEHYWGKKHFLVVEDYFDKRFKENPELKPKYIPSIIFNRPLPQAILSKCTSNLCGLCKIIFSDEGNQAQEHYSCHQHEKKVSKFLQTNPQHWKEGFVSEKIIIQKPAKVPACELAPDSWFPNCSQSYSLPLELKSQFKQSTCKLCSVTLISEAVGRNHYKGRKHLKNVEQFLKPDPEERKDDLCDEFHFGDEEVMFSDNSKEVVTLSEEGNDNIDLNTVFIGCDVTDGEVQGVTLLDFEGTVVLDDLVAPFLMEMEQTVIFKARLQDALAGKTLVGCDLSKKLKALNIDHPEHLSRDLSSRFVGLRPGIKSSLHFIVRTCLNSDYLQSKDNEAKVSLEIYKKTSATWKETKPHSLQCRILMSQSVIDVMKNKRTKKKLKEVHGMGDDVQLHIPFVGSVITLSGCDVDSVIKSLYDLVKLIKYAQLETELKLIVPSKLKLRKKDFATGSNTVSMYSRLLLNSKEKVVGFGGGDWAMVSGVSQCLKLMKENDCSYGGLGVRYDCSDHDETSVYLYGGWPGDGRNTTERDLELSVLCFSCQIEGVEHFSLTQLGKGNSKRCRRCISL